MKPRFRICFSHGHVWFYKGEEIVGSYMIGSKIYYDHSSGECELKWFDKPFLS